MVDMFLCMDYCNGGGELGLTLFFSGGMELRKQKERLGGKKMKVLSMIQPWASLFVLREAAYETRTWRTHYRGPLAIHTSKKIDHAVCNHIAIQRLLAKHGYSKDMLPTGKIIAMCKLKNCLKVKELHRTSAVLEDGRVVSGNDFYLGDYQVGNYVWEIEQMQLLPEFISAKGHLGLWEHELHHD